MHRHAAQLRQPRLRNVQCVSPLDDRSSYLFLFIKINNTLFSLLRKSDFEEIFTLMNL